MRFSSVFTIAACMVFSAKGGLVAVRSPPVQHDLYPVLHGRQIFPAISLGSYDLATSAQTEVLFDLTGNVGQGHAGEGVGVKVTCVDCRTWGTAVVSTTGVEEDHDIIDGIMDFFKDPEQTILDAFSVDLKLELDNVGGHFEFDIDALAALSYSIPIFQSLTPLGGAIGDDVSIGIVLSVELVFSVTAKLDLTAGFDFSFPENTFITVDPLTGEIKEDGFLDGEVDPLPITVTSGTATFKAALKVKLQAGTTVDLFGTGFDFQLGVYANVIEYVATVSSTETCALHITQLLDVNVGAFAQHVIKFNFVAVGGSPPFVTTILTVPLPSLCITAGQGVQATSLPLITDGVGSGIVTTSPTATPSGGVFHEQPAPSVTASSSAVSGGYDIISPSETSTQIPDFTPPLTLSASFSSTTRTPIAITSTIIPDFNFNHTLSISSSSIRPSATNSLSYSNTSPVYQNTTRASFTSLNTLTVSPPSQSLITTTIYQTTTLTLCACSSPLINCPTSLASTILVTSTRVLYTTVCPPGAILPTTLPLTSSLRPTTTAANGVGVKVTPSITRAISSLHLILLPTPIVETIYTPVFDHPIHTLPSNAAIYSTSTTSRPTIAALPTGGNGKVGGAVGIKLFNGPLPTLSLLSTSASITGTGTGLYDASPRETGTAVQRPSGTVVTLAGAETTQKAKQLVAVGAAGGRKSISWSSIWMMGVMGALVTVVTSMLD